MSEIRPTPLHPRTAALNRRNAWTERNGLTLARDYGDRDGEALAARVSAVVADISWRWRVTFEGAGVNDMLARVFTRDARGLAAGAGVKALWLNDAGGVRGAGLVARMGDAQVLLAASAPDRAWIFTAAKAFGVDAKDVSDSQAGMAVIGPQASRLLSAAGLDPALDLLASRVCDWRGVAATLSRWGEHGGYELWCDSDDATLVWDRLLKAGTAFGARAAGLDALDILDLERGVARPHRDYRPALDGHGVEPQPESLGLERLVDESHRDFNGRAAWLAHRGKAGKTVAGLVFEGDVSAPHAPVLRGAAPVGHTFGSFYSPSLRRALALAQLDRKEAAPGRELFVPLPSTIDAPVERVCKVRVVELPFLPSPDPLPV